MFRRLFLLTTSILVLSKMDHSLAQVVAVEEQAAAAAPPKNLPIRHPLPTPNITTYYDSTGLLDPSLRLWALGHPVHLGSLFDARKMAFMDNSAFITQRPDDQLVVRLPSHESFESIGLVERPSDLFKLFNFDKLQAINIQTGQIRMKNSFVTGPDGTTRTKTTIKETIDSDRTSDIIKALRQWLSTQSLDGGSTNPARILKDTEPFNYWLKYSKTAEEYLDLVHDGASLDVDYQNLDPSVSAATHVLVGIEFGAGVVVRSKHNVNKLDGTGTGKKRQGKSSAFFENPEVHSDIPLHPRNTVVKSSSSFLGQNQNFRDSRLLPHFRPGTTSVILPDSEVPAVERTNFGQKSGVTFPIIPTKSKLNPPTTTTTASSPLLSTFRSTENSLKAGLADHRGSFDLSRDWPWSSSKKQKRQVTTVTDKLESDQVDPLIKELMDQFQQRLNSTGEEYTKPLIYTLISVRDFVRLVASLSESSVDDPSKSPPILLNDSKSLKEASEIFDGIALAGNRLARLLAKMQLSVDSLSYQDLGEAEVLQRKFFKTSRDFARTLREVMQVTNVDTDFDPIFSNYRASSHSYGAVDQQLDTTFKETSEKIKLHEWILRESGVNYLGRHSSIHNVRFSPKDSSQNETYLLFFKELTTHSTTWPWLQKRSAFFNLLRDNPANAGHLYVVDCNFAYNFETCDDLKEPVIHVYRADELYSTTFPLSAGQVPPVESGCEIIASGVSLDDQKLIEELHNKFRLQVSQGKENRGNPGPQPAPGQPLADLAWSEELAKKAQLWASECKLAYEKPEDRRTEKYPIVGQNVIKFSTILGSRVSGPVASQWSRAVTDWYNKVEEFDSNLVDSFEHSSGDAYSQIVWAETTEVGCGYAQFEDKNKDGQAVAASLYVCNYGPKGNKINNQVYPIGISQSVRTAQSSDLESKVE